MLEVRDGGMGGRGRVLRNRSKRVCVFPSSERKNMALSQFREGIENTMAMTKNSVYL